MRAIMLAVLCVFALLGTSHTQVRADDWCRTQTNACHGASPAWEEYPSARRQRWTDGRPRAWCGWWMAIRKGIHDRSLWVARNWARVGSPAAGPCVGCIGVMRHHVYEVVEVVGPGRVLAISGNDGHAVRTRVRSTAGTFAWRRV